MEKAEKKPKEKTGKKLRGKKNVNFLALVENEKETI